MMKSSIGVHHLNDAEKYKQAHEAFVSGLHGTTASDVMLCLIHVPVFVFITFGIQHIIHMSMWTGNSSRWISVIVEILVAVLPLVLIMTMWANVQMTTLPISIIVVFLISIWMKRKVSKASGAKCESDRMNSEASISELDVTVHGDQHDVYNIDNSLNVGGSNNKTVVTMRKPVTVSSVNGPSTSTSVGTSSLTARSQSQSKYFITLFKGMNIASFQ